MERTDILTIDDLPLEIRVNVTMMRTRKKNHARSELRKAEEIFARAGFPRWVALPAPEVV